jgi:hypothetical protein
MLALYCPAARADSGPAAISPKEFKARLESLDRLVAACAHAVTADNCQSGEVGLDAQVTLPAGNRTIRFDWLRETLDDVVKETEDKSQAAKPADKGPADKDPAKKQESTVNPETPLHPSLPPEPKLTIPERLQAARDRLHEEWSWAGGDTSETSAAAAQRQALKRILAAKEYQYAVAKPTIWDRIREKLSLWIDKTFGALADLAPKARWFGRAIQIGVVLLFCIGLAWILISLERQGRLAAHFRPEVREGAASARDWQLWLKDARQAAAQGEWRDAIHLIYWASISRLESSGQWPADRARTPREYLALLGEDNSQRPSLTALTRSFERTWYAGQNAVESDFERAEQLAGTLGAR